MPQCRLSSAGAAGVRGVELLARVPGGGLGVLVGVPAGVHQAGQAEEEVSGGRHLGGGQRLV